MKGLLVCTQVGMQVVAPSKSLSTANMVTVKGLLTRVGTLVTLQVTEIPESLVAGGAKVLAMVLLVVFSSCRGGYLLLFCC